MLAERFKASPELATLTLEAPEFEALSDAQLVALVEHGLLPYLYQGTVVWPVIDASDPPLSPIPPKAPHGDRCSRPQRVVASTALLSLGLAWAMEELVEFCLAHKAHSWP